MIREQRFNGILYPDNYNETKKIINEAMDRVFDVKVPSPRMIIVPNESYRVASDYYAASYDPVQNIDPDIVIIISTVHNIAFKGIALPAFTGFRYFDHIFEVEKSAAGMIAEMFEGSFIVETDYHGEEFSIETQLPMLDYIFKNKPKILPILIGEQTTKFTTVLANALYKICFATNKKILIVLPTILSTGLKYEDAKRMDSLFVDVLNAGKADHLAEQLAMRVISADNGAGIVSALRLIEKENKVFKFRQLKSGNTGDHIDEKNIVTGYLSGLILE